MEFKQVDLGTFPDYIPPPEPAPEPQPAPKPTDAKPAEGKREKKKRPPHKVFMPLSSNFIQWIENEDFRYWYILMPSRRLQDVWYKVSIDKITREMTCDCPAFKGIEGVKAGNGECGHVNRLLWAVKLKGRNTRELSFEAKLSISYDAMEGMKKRIFDLLLEHPHTCDELEVITGLIHQTCSPVIRSLVKEGIVENSGDERETRRHRSAIVWHIA